MKSKSGILSRGIVFVLLTISLKANPIAIHIINEIYLSETDSLGWTLELHNWPGLMDSYDGCFITGSTGTAHFKEGILTGQQELILIHADSLETPLALYQDGGVISLFDQDSNRIEEIRWGNVENPDVGAPLNGQSLAYRYDWPPGEIWYLDNSPTLGDWNDQENARGSLAGTVYDMNGAPIPSAMVLYGYGFTQFVLSDSQGQYELENIACLAHLRVNINGVDQFDSTLQVYPDSVIILDCYLDNYVGIGPHNSELPPLSFALMQNYPNPFNGFTSIRFEVPIAADVQLEIMTLDGSRMVSLVQQSLTPGSYQVHWDAQLIPSGLYLYQMRAGSFTDTKKMLIIK